jgi:signal transduction histidine kinase
MTVNSHSTVTVKHLQLLVEQDKTALAHEIHDVLGGHLIATAMDLALLMRRLTDTDPAALATIERATQSLNDAIDMMRRVTEELHPTLLDNVGLFAALRWQIKHMCHRANIACTERFPELEPRLSPATSITLFRVGQEALVVAENHPGATLVDFTMTLDSDLLTMRVWANGVSTPPDPNGRGHIALEFLRHRIDAMGGTVSLSHPAHGGMVLLAHIRLDAISVTDTQSVRILEMAAAPAAAIGQDLGQERK